MLADNEVVWHSDSTESNMKPDCEQLPIIMIMS